MGEGQGAEGGALFWKGGAWGAMHPSLVAYTGVLRKLSPRSEQEHRQAPAVAQRGAFAGAPNLASGRPRMGQRSGDGSGQSLLLQTEVPGGTSPLPKLPCVMLECRGGFTARGRGRV